MRLRLQQVTESWTDQDHSLSVRQVRRDSRARSRTGSASLRGPRPLHARVPDPDPEPDMSRPAPRDVCGLRMTRLESTSIDWRAFESAPPRILLS
jgi:hypothetical protein